MSRKEFLRLLRKHLSFLTKEELEKEVLYYINKIDSTKLADTEVIASFGTMEDILEEVCKRHGLNSKEIQKKDQNWLLSFYENLISLSTLLKNSDSKKRTRLMLDIVMLLFITCILKIPFLFIRDMGDKVIEVFLSSNITILAIWGLGLEIVYVIVALAYFIRTFDKWFNTLKIK